MKSFRIATYNVNSIRSRLHIVIPWLREHRPDVLCLQETKVKDSLFPAEEFLAAGYGVAYRGMSQYNGVAAAFRQEPRQVAFGLDDGSPADEDRLMVLSWPGITVINTYVPQGRDPQSEHFAYKLEWFRRLRLFLSRRYSPETPLIWCGDMNVAPEAIDVHDPKGLLGHVCFNQQVWEAFAAVKEFGLQDIFRRHHKDEPGCYTFFDYRVPQAVKRGLGWRVDHILATAPLAERSLSCDIDLGPRLAERPSDHTILTAEFAVEDHDGHRPHK